MNQQERERLVPGDILESTDKPGFNWSHSALFSNIDLTQAQIQLIKENLLPDNGIYIHAYLPNIRFRVLALKRSKRRAIVSILNGACAGKFIDLDLTFAMKFLTSDPDDNY